MIVGAEKEEILLLFQAFYPPELASRWEALLSSKPQRWSKIDPWKTWELLPCTSGHLAEFTQNLNSLLHSPSFLKHAEAPVVALRCGHASPAIETLLLNAALLGERSVFEGFISIIPGKLGLAINHDGSVCVLEK